MPELKPMYPVRESLLVQTAGAITAAATTILVSNPDAFLPGPNVATIGTDNSYEVIIYSGKSGNQLTGCQRGQSGSVAKAWPENSRIYNSWTGLVAGNMMDNIKAVNEAVEDATTLTGAVDPSLSTVGVVGQQYLNTKTRRLFVCVKISGSTYTWVSESGGGVAPKIVGVSWNFNSTSTALTRLTPSTDPNGFVTENITTDPVPAIGDGAGSSPFDGLMPWAGMKEYNVIDGELGLAKGETGFSRTANDTVITIPKFWYRIEKDTTAKLMRFYISDRETAGFTLHEAFDRGDGVVRDLIAVGKYNTGSGYVSKSGLAALVSITRTAARTGSKGKGTKWHLYDYAAWCAIGLLYVVEFADWNSQAKIGRGIVDGSSSNKQNSGATDSMTYHTGRAAGTDGLTSVKYREIENLWGNVRDWVDGFNANNRVTYVCLNPADFADGTDSKYTATGVTLPSSGYIKELGFSGYIKELGFSEACPFAFLPLVNGGSETTYVPDYVGSNAGWVALNVGGLYSDAGAAGLFYFYASNAASYSNSNLGARLLYLP